MQEGVLTILATLPMAEGVRHSYRGVNNRGNQMNIKDKALLVIEGLACEDMTMPPGKKLSMIYKFAHIAGGQCNNPHESWVKFLDDTYKALKKHGII